MASYGRSTFLIWQVESAHYQTAMPEEYVMIMETDHMLMHAPPNVATEQKPAGRPTQ